MGRDEIFQYAQPLLQGRLDRKLDRLSLRIGDQPLHTHHLYRLRPCAARAGIDDLIDRIFFMERNSEKLRDLAFRLIPHRDRARSPLFVGQKPFVELLANPFHFLLGRLEERGLLCRDDKIFHRPRDPRARRHFEPEYLDLVDSFAHSIKIILVHDLLDHLI